MSEWKTVRLGDVCEIPITDGTHQTPAYAKAEDGIPFLSSKDVTTQTIDWNNIKYITKELHETLYKRISPQKDDVLLAKNGTTGVAALVEDNRVFDIYVTLALLRPNQEIIYPKYLLRVINSPSCKRQFNSHLKGVGVPNLHLKEINETKIPLPPLETQKQIAAQLDKCTSIITKHKQMLEKYDTLIKSRFIEMFGDDKYPKIHISEMVERKVASAKKIFDKKDEIKYIDISSVDNKINEIVGYTECVFEEAPSRAQQHIRQNDILISTVRPNLKNIAINKLPYTETVASSGFCVLRPKYVPEYLFVAVLQDKFTDDMVAVTTGANYPAIKDSDILNYEIANPPIELQTAFARFVQQIDKSKFTVQKSLEKAETLYKSLMQEYFE